ncbi:DnaJ family domain-containing protein [Streptomyces cavernicola]|uniref:DUF1992 domain-containing protein n=1 Tax=Streptomyces cavernicola TaxID=3043613 RepID=A0ABT6S9B8_9ACTN|nr:DUF1992 domain-containing protein [Streptomyces sp. B-S-A6]MDI3404705.1 DUF1992 domain-containing protein [Streptomyces sp. B-S-A6]
MTERKPPGVSFESWVDKQIREAEERGDFADLPGIGRPLPDLDRPYDEMWWLKEKMRRENVSVLPPALALRKEAEEALAAAEAAPTEATARSILTEINKKISATLLRPPPGPPLGIKPYDVDEVLARRRTAREG